MRVFFSRHNTRARAHVSVRPTPRARASSGAAAKHISSLLVVRARPRPPLACAGRWESSESLPRVVGEGLNVLPFTLYGFSGATHMQHISAALNS